jgi:hypothetical protein
MPLRSFVVLFAASAAVLGAFAGCQTKPVNSGVSVARPDAAGDRPLAPDPDPPGGDAGAGPTCETPATLKTAGEDCSCDNECANGFCQDGACCTGAACGKRPAGAPCQMPDQCDSGFCADGVCCNVACTGACVSCNQQDRMGECVPVPAGLPDVHGGCRMDPPDSCGQSGFCNGQGGCAKHPPGTTCGLGTCDDGRTLLGASECDGDGTCVAASALDCAPFTCQAGACRGSCASNADCTAPAVCTAGSCGMRGRGQACTTGDQCQSTFCVDGVCCDSACGGRCRSCALPSARGTCTPVPANAPDPRAAAGQQGNDVCVDEGPASCGTDGRCDGSGGCQRYRNGTVCRAGRCDTGSNSETPAAVCDDGQCRTPAARSCAPYRGCSGARCISQCGSDSQCASGNVCSGGSCGRRPRGAACSRDGDCADPGICAQGRCCDRACNGTCMACNVEGSLGTCRPVPAMGADPTGTCRDDTCTNGCDGNGGCLRERPGTTCRPASCGAGGITRSTCNAAGACTSTTTACPAGQVCMGDRCAPPAKKGLGEACVAGAECASNACVAGRCCASACAGPCKVCTAGSNWTCVNAPASTPCGDGRQCAAGVCSKKGPGQSCSDGVECQSGTCSNGGCCATACAGACRTCSAASMWQCRAVDGGTCGMGNVCRNGSCVAPCPGNQTVCGQTCVNLNNDPANCGECRRACASGRCMQGTCADECPAGSMACPPLRRCVNVQNDRLNCGRCNNICGPLQVCRMGKCGPRGGGGPGTDDNSGA